MEESEEFDNCERQDFRNSRRRCRFDENPSTKLSYYDDDVEIEYRSDPKSSAKILRRKRG